MSIDSLAKFPNRLHVELEFFGHSHHAMVSIRDVVRQELQGYIFFLGDRSVYFSENECVLVLSADPAGLFRGADEQLPLV